MSFLVFQQTHMGKHTKAKGQASPAQDLSFQCWETDTLCNVIKYEIMYYRLWRHKYVKFNNCIILSRHT